MAMGKKRNGEGSAAREERAPAAQIEREDGEGDGGAQRLAVSAPKGGIETPPAPTKTQPFPRNYNELGGGIFARHHPVDVGCEVLEKSDDRGAATKLRALQTYAAWTFGKSGAEGDRTPPRIIWDIPGPPYEPADPEQEKLEGGEK
jgi:hypothetical protein